MKQNGFTLIELLVVISIIGILSGLLFVNFSGVRERGRDAVRKNDLQQIKTALRLYYNDNQQFPEHTDPGFLIEACPTATVYGGGCIWGAQFSETTSYIMLPRDPLNTGNYTYRYYQTGGGEGFQLCSVLENASDAQAAQSRQACGITSNTQAPCGNNSPTVFDRIYMQCSK